MNFRNILKRCIPGRYAKRSARSRFVVGYPSREAVMKESDGYDSNRIFERVSAAALRVKRGEAACERDGVSFNEMQYAWHITSSLLMAALNRHGRAFEVLDFGGSLGSTYFQQKKFFDSLEAFKWRIVEQPRFVEFGNEKIADSSVCFFDTLDGALEKGTPDAVLFSSVLQYLPDPYIVLKDVVQSGAPYIIVDRTPFLRNGETDLPAKQIVPASIYSASYPAWLFGDRLLEFLRESGYRRVAEFPKKPQMTENDNITFDWRGFLFSKNSD